MPHMLNRPLNTRKAPSVNSAQAHLAASWDTSLMHAKQTQCSSHFMALVTNLHAALRLVMVFSGAPAVVVMMAPAVEAWLQF